MKKSIILLAFVVATFIYIVNLWFTISGIYLFLAAIFILGGLVFFSKTFRTLNTIDYSTLLTLVLVLFTILSFTLEATDVNGLESLAMWLGRSLMFIAVIASLFYILDLKQGKLFQFISRHKFVILIAVSFLIQLSLLKILRTPEVDIYNITKYGPLSLFAGKNPYTSSNHYEFYTYGPASIFLFLPFDVLLRDPRYLLILCNFLTAFALYKISKKSFHKQNESEMLALIYLFHPRYPNLLNSTSTDVVIVGLLAFALLSFAHKRYRQFGVGLALLVGIKLLYAIPLIFFLKYKHLNFRKIAPAGIITLTLMYLPFLISNANAIIYSSLLFHFAQNETLFLQKAVITLAAFINRQWGYFPPSYVFPISNIIIIAALWIKTKTTDNFTKTLAIISFVFLISIFLSQQALPGYYFVATSFLLFSIAFNKEAVSE